MPHLTLEYSANVKIQSDFSDLFRKLHRILSETGGIKLENCKSRAYAAENYYIGSGSNRNGFVHLDVRFLEGRSADLKTRIANEMENTLVEWFQASNSSLDLQVTIELQDIVRSFYFKHPKGTLTKVLP